jgi:hypothetical protein
MLNQSYIDPVHVGALSIGWEFSPKDQLNAYKGKSKTNCYIDSYLDVAQMRRGRYCKYKHFPEQNN